MSYNYKYNKVMGHLTHKPEVVDNTSVPFVKIKKSRDTNREDGTKTDTLQFTCGISTTLPLVSTLPHENVVDYMEHAIVEHIYGGIRLKLIEMKLKLENGYSASLIEDIEDILRELN
jgi:hypothetical protein